MTRRRMIPTVCAGFLAGIAGIFALSGGSLATTVLIVLGWLAAGLLMARSR